NWTTIPLNIYMNSSQFIGLYETFEKHERYLVVQRAATLVNGITTTIVVSFTLYVMNTSAANLSHLVKVLMYCNVLFPALLTSVICFLFVPYLLLPYPIALNLGPIRFGLVSTLLHVIFMFGFGSYACLSIGYSIALNYITVCHAWFLETTAFTLTKWLSLIIPTIFLMALGIHLSYSMLNDTSSTLSMVAVDSRNAIFSEKFAAIVIHLDIFGLDPILYGSVLLYIGVIAAAVTMLYRVVQRIRAKKNEFSKTTYRLHLNVVVALVAYCVILFLQLLLPVMLLVITALFKLAWMNSMPYMEILLFLPISLFSISTCIMYMVVIRPFRKTVSRLIYRLYETIPPLKSASRIAAAQEPTMRLAGSTNKFSQSSATK
ncbi:hypothetical protein V3C99_007327, partial [Haemonchus contortus]|uniref:G protein-coupled receptor n=1 Tax=Haemonchus contortus TaxID=6289 RepID=A0A7I4YPQ4_HAECO